jgi:peptide/nickel transport system substrate-binding protein
MDTERREYAHELKAAYRKGLIDRREFIRWSAILGLSIPLLDVSQVKAAGLAAPVRGGTFRIGTTPPTSIEPHMLIDGPGITFVHQVCEMLVEQDSHGVIRPRLATSWTPSQGSKVWTVKLRQGVKFHNGQMMTADDVVASYKRVLDKASGSTAVATYQSFLSKNGVKKVDQFTVEFNLNRAVVDFPGYMHQYQAVILPANWPGHFGKNPWGTGAFKLVEYVPGQRAKFVRNPDYWIPGLPYLAGVQIVWLSLDGVVQAILGGSIDWGGNAASLPVLRANPNIRTLTVASSEHRGIFMRTDTAPYNDKRVRQALALGLNRPDIVKSVVQGLAVLGNDNVFSPSYAVYSPIPQRAQDVAKAKALLSAAGHPNGFSATLVTTSDTSFLVPLAEVAQQMWKPLGVNITIKPEPGSVYYNTDWLQTPLNATDWGDRVTPSVFLDSAYLTNAVWNASHWSNPTFDGLVKQFDSEVDFAKRKAIARKIELLMTDETPSIIPFFLQSASFVRSNVQGYIADGIGFTDLRRTYLSATP